MPSGNEFGIEAILNSTQAKPIRHLVKNESYDFLTEVGGKAGNVRVGVALVDRVRDEKRGPVLYVASEGRLAPHTVPFGHVYEAKGTITGAAVMQGRPQFEEHGKKTFRHNQGEEVNGAIALPLHIPDMRDPTKKGPVYGALLIEGLPGVKNNISSSLIGSLEGDVRQNGRSFYNFVNGAIDTKTGLFTESLYHEALREMLGQSELRNTPLSIMMIDLDRFKAINDKGGHLAGDAVLRQFGDQVAYQFPDWIRARTGGDEFVVVLPGPLSTANGYANMLETEFLARTIGFKPNGHTLDDGVTLSIGVADTTQIAPWLKYTKHPLRGDVSEIDAKIDVLTAIADAAAYASKGMFTHRFEEGGWFEEQGVEKKGRVSYWTPTPKDHMSSGSLRFVPDGATSGIVVDRTTKGKYFVVSPKPLVR